MKPRYLYKLALIVSFAVMPVAVGATELREVALLIESGASGLAMQVLDQEQPALENNPEHWLEWEDQRIKLFRHSKDWDGLINRLQQLPGWVPKEFKLKSLEIIARAQIEKKDTDAALKTLRQLLWRFEEGEGSSIVELSLPVWRQLIIQAYLVAENIADAEVAMLRFQQDHASTRGDWKRSRATVLIRAGKPEDAQLLMAGEPHMHSRTIYYLAQLLGKKAKPESIYKNTKKLASKKKFADSTRRQFWVVASKAAKQLGKDESAIRAMQNALLLLDRNQVLSQREKLLFAVNGADLWRLYEAYGRRLGNRWQLLSGNDDEWFAKASNLVDKKPLQAMALFAAMSKTTTQLRTRKLAHELFASMLAKEKQGLLLVQQIYLDDTSIEKMAFIPEDLRHRLVEDALAESDIKTASRLIQTVNEPPKGEDAIFWKMRRARILILAGKLDDGIKALHELLEGLLLLQTDQIDRMMQVLFDLQTVGRHEEAIALFRKLPLEGQNGQMRREILYWMADSYKEQKQYRQAARHYLLSAGLLNSTAMDPWAQTARYQAADALLNAGVYEDAGRIYNGLLKITTEPGRKVVLKNKIQQIWLLSNQQ